MVSGPNKRRAVENKAKQDLLNMRRLASDDKQIVNAHVGYRLVPLESRLEQLGLRGNKSVESDILYIKNRLTELSGSVFEQAYHEGFAPEDSIIVRVLNKVIDPDIGDHYAAQIKKGLILSSGPRILLDESKDSVPGSYRLAFPQALGYLTKSFAHAPISKAIDGIFTDPDRSSTMLVGRFYDIPMEAGRNDHLGYVVPFAGPSTNAWVTSVEPDRVAKALGLETDVVQVLDELKSTPEGDRALITTFSNEETRPQVVKAAMMYLDK